VNRVRQWTELDTVYEYSIHCLDTVYEYSIHCLRILENTLRFEYWKIRVFFSIQIFERSGTKKCVYNFHWSWVYSLWLQRVAKSPSFECLWIKVYTFFSIHTFERSGTKNYSSALYFVFKKNVYIYTYIYMYVYIYIYMCIYIYIFIFCTYTCARSSTKKNSFRHVFWFSKKRLYTCVYIFRKMHIYIYIYIYVYICIFFSIHTIERSGTKNYSFRLYFVSKFERLAYLAHKIPVLYIHVYKVGSLLHKRYLCIYIYAHIYMYIYIYIKNTCFMYTCI